MNNHISQRFNKRISALPEEINVLIDNIDLQ